MTARDDGSFVMTKEKRDRLISWARKNPDVGTVELGEMFGCDSGRVARILREAGIDCSAYWVSDFVDAVDRGERLVIERSRHKSWPSFNEWIMTGWQQKKGVA